MSTPKVRAWVIAARPATLGVAVAPVAVGAALARAHGAVRVGPLVGALAGAVLIQIGTNFANDVFDHEKGADTTHRVGPIRATQAGLLTGREVRWGTAVAFALAAAVGAYLAAVAGWVVVAIGAASIASGLAYTGGPWPLGYHGLGDAFVFVFFGGVAVIGTSFVAGGSGAEAAAMAAAAPIGALATAVLVVNNVRDEAGDRVAGKRTLVVRFGRRFGVAEYAALVAVAYFVPIAMWTMHLAGPAALAPLATAPWGIALVRRVAAARGAALNPLLGATARLLVVYAGAFAVGIGGG